VANAQLRLAELDARDKVGLGQARDAREVRRGESPARRGTARRSQNRAVPAKLCVLAI
jgi:hypothetical protein